MSICVNVKKKTHKTHTQKKKKKKKKKTTTTTTTTKKKPKKPNKQTCIYLSVMVHSNQNIFLTIL